MKIGFDVSQTGNFKAGCGYFADGLIRALADLDDRNIYKLYPTFGDYFWDDEYQKTCNIDQPNFSIGLHHSSHHAAKTFWQHPNHKLEGKLGCPDIVHANNYFCSDHFKRAKLVYTLYDLSYVFHPDWTTEANRLACFNGVLNASLYADLVVAISEYSRSDFLRVFPYVSPEKVKVIYPASRFSGEKKAVSVPKYEALFLGGFWLSVGTLEPRKNYPRLLEAYAKLKATQQHTLPLVIAGGKGWMMDDLNELLARLHLSRRDVYLLGYVSDEKMQWLYENCFAFVYPSTFEGFGMPVLEAMSLGAAVVSSQTTSVPEIVGDAGVLIDPYNVEDIFQGMFSLVNNDDYRESLRAKAIERARLFSWHFSAEKMLHFYQELSQGKIYG